MAEVLGVVAAAAQGAEGCLKLYGTFERLYYTSQTLRRYQQRIEEVRQLLSLINDNPAFDTPGISRCTRVLEEHIRSINVSIGNRKRDRLLTSLSIIIKERQLSETFACIEETKSSLSLYLAGINHKVLYEIRSNLKIAAQRSGIDNEAEIENMMGSEADMDMDSTPNSQISTGFRPPTTQDPQFNNSNQVHASLFHEHIPPELPIDAMRPERDQNIPQETQGRLLDSHSDSESWQQECLDFFARTGLVLQAPSNSQLAPVPQVPQGVQHRDNQYYGTPGNEVASGYEQRARYDFERRMTHLVSPERHCQRMPRCEPSSRCDQCRQMDSQSSAQFDGNKHNGWASQINGMRLTRNLSDDEAARLTNNQVWENHTKEKPKTQKPDGMEASQVNGVQVEGDFRVPRIHGIYRNNVQKANGIQVNGYDL
ncbi:putative Fungal N-terminal domain-containing protein [Seiridium unicorne]|uniref:Fungal N-terminal domain-containing protein n=1 Tax=Seiridium unicorne TaxID=138068 RepID=A0ABR2UGI8_9PEZI